MCEQRCSQMGNGAQVATARNFRFELEVFAHSPTIERTRLVSKLGSDKLVDEWTQTPGGLAIVDIYAAQSTARHGIRDGIGRILDNRRASAHFDPAQARAAVIQCARQYHADHSRTERQRS